MEVFKVFNVEKASQEEIDTFFVSKSVRGIILDELGDIALIHAKNNEYYELPGGGVEKGETLEEGYLREMREETGCNVEIIKAIGTVEEIRKRNRQVHRSTCFIAQVVGEKGETTMTPKEIGEGKEIMWVTPEKALEHIRSSNTKGELYHIYVQERDTTFIQAFKSA